MTHNERRLGKFALASAVIHLMLIVVVVAAPSGKQPDTPPLVIELRPPPASKGAGQEPRKAGTSVPPTTAPKRAAAPVRKEPVAKRTEAPPQLPPAPKAPAVAPAVPPAPAPQVSEPVAAASQALPAPAAVPQPEKPAETVQPSTVGSPTGTGTVAVAESGDASSGKGSKSSEADPDSDAESVIPLDSQHLKYHGYLSQVREAIDRNWVDPRKVREDRRGRVIVEFEIAKNGNLLSVDVQNVTGGRDFEEAAVRAIRSTQFSRIPDNIRKTKPLKLSMLFHYHVE